MTAFACLIEPTGQAIGGRARAAFEPFRRKCKCDLSWRSWDGIAVLAPSPGGDDLSVAEVGALIGVGTLRLDNRSDLEALLASLESPGPCANDLEVVMRLTHHYGPQVLSRILGDFAFVVWNRQTRSGVAASDVFALKPLYFVERDGLIVFASRSEPLARADRYNVQYLAERIAYCHPISPGLTVYDGVSAVPAATAAVVARGALTLRRYWSAAECGSPPRYRIDRDEAASEVRRLLSDSVRLRLNPSGGNWAELSGGLDSSGVVSTAQWLVERGRAPHGLDGTITYVDHPEIPDNDISYVRDVAERWALRNEYLVGVPRWWTSRFGFPSTDYPDGHFSAFPRENLTADIVRLSRGRVLLTGLGGDELFCGNRFYYADLLASGRIRQLATELITRATVERRSVWQFARRAVVQPFLPKPIADFLESPVNLIRLPEWYQPKPFQQIGIRNFGEPPLATRRRVGRMYHDERVMRLESLIGRGRRPVMASLVDVRHPFLYRPLVEFVLGLPAELSMRPLESKPVLRAALRGLLPDRTKRTGSAEHCPPGALNSWKPNEALIRQLIHEPILAELGIVDGGKLRRAVHARGLVPRHRDYMDAVLQQTLEVEAWLKNRSGRLCGAAQGQASSEIDESVAAFAN